MSAQTGEIRAVAWSEVFPWLMIVRALRLATSAPILLVATMAVLLLPWGWHAAAFSWVNPRNRVRTGCPFPTAYGPSSPSIDARRTRPLRRPGSCPAVGSEFAGPDVPGLAGWRPAGAAPVSPRCVVERVGLFRARHVLEHRRVGLFRRDHRPNSRDAVRARRARGTGRCGAVRGQTVLRRSWVRRCFRLPASPSSSCARSPSGGCCDSMWESCRPRSCGSSSCSAACWRPSCSSACSSAGR